MSPTLKIDKFELKSKILHIIDISYVSDYYLDSYIFIKNTLSNFELS